MNLELLKQLKIAVLSLLLFTVITGVIYPLVITGLAQFFFPWQANGSLIKHNDKTIGSVLIGQAFDEPRYFWSRPSATQPFPYNALASSGSNLAPTNPDFLTTVKNRIELLQKVATNNHKKIPIELVTASGSGLDPDISPGAAYYQISRVAKARGLPIDEVKQLVQRMIQNRQLGFLGEPRVNVLELNIALDEFSQQKIIKQ